MAEPIIGVQNVEMARECGLCIKLMMTSSYQVRIQGKKESISSDKTPAEKIVTFSPLQEKENTEYKPEPQLKVKDEPLRDAKAYLAQYSDFRQGGMQGS